MTETFERWRGHARLVIDQAELLDSQLRELHSPASNTLRVFSSVCQRHHRQPLHPPQVCAECTYVDQVLCSDCDQVMPCNTTFVLDARKAIRDKRKVT